MSEAQMKFLEERRRQRGSEAQQATGEAPPDSSHELGQRYTGYGSFEAQSEVLPVIKTEDVWTCKCGDGRLGSYFVAFHKPSGAAVELLQGLSSLKPSCWLSPPAPLRHRWRLLFPASKRIPGT
eukprot:242329-Hanusia_phi.AAC.3